ncbi:hypothetical protein DL767_002463 [Monosporascus sp. MG133]|nr:hypothetical protein DL767_002463 [Monosporascus sp. MG133]
MQPVQVSHGKTTFAICDSLMRRGEHAVERIRGAAAGGHYHSRQRGLRRQNRSADTSTLDSSDVIIDVSELKAITFNSDKTEVTFHAGITNADMIRAAWDNDARVSTSTCNCVSLLGATLGGGLSRTQRVYGLNVDEILSLNLVDAVGNKNTVTAQSDPDLRTAWADPVVFDQSQPEQAISAINDIDLEPEMQLHLYFTVSAPDNAPTVVVLPFYLGSEEAGRQKFVPILAVGPAADGTAVLPYYVWNDAANAFCARGGRRPSYGAELKTMDPATWRGVWSEYEPFLERHPGEAGNSTVLMECYSTERHAIAISWYDGPALDDEANEFSRKARRYWTVSDEAPSPVAYINFAHGDEPPDRIYGSSLTRLQHLKRKYDPKNHFNQWFPLS